MAKRTLVSVIISNFKDIKNLKRCLESIKENVSLKYVEVVVVDYGTASLEAFTRRYFPFVKLIRLKGDVGVPAQRNIGALVSKGDYLFFLDNDTNVCNGCIENLLAVLKSDLSIAVALPKTLVLSMAE